MTRMIYAGMRCKITEKEARWCSSYEVSGRSKVLTIIIVHVDSNGLVDKGGLSSTMSNHFFKRFHHLGHGGTVLMVLSPHSFDELDDFWAPLFP
jgi:hypothetical protein